MATINVRWLDQGVVDRFKQRASANNRSLEGEVRHILEGLDAMLQGEDSEADGRAERIAFADEMKRLRRLTEGLDLIPAEEAIRAGRDHCHRDKF